MPHDHSRRSLSAVVTTTADEAGRLVHDAQREDRPLGMLIVDRALEDLRSRAVGTPHDVAATPLNDARCTVAADVNAGPCVEIHLALSPRQHDMFTRAARMMETTIGDYLRVAALRGRQRGDLLDDERDRAAGHDVRSSSDGIASTSEPALLSPAPGTLEARLAGCSCQPVDGLPRRTKYGRSSGRGVRIDEHCPVHGRPRGS
jgi:hypothetical protein